MEHLTASLHPSVGKNVKKTKRGGGVVVMKEGSWAPSAGRRHPWRAELARH